MDSKKIVVFGNSGSGKSTLASYLSVKEGLAHLDLDSVAWEPSSTPQRRDIDQSKQQIDVFTQGNSEWVVEGCYSDLLELVVPQSTEMIYMNLPVSLCIENAKARPWEPHKYESKAAQDEKLEMLIEWIKNYSVRQDEFSEKAHHALYMAYTGQKTMYAENQHYE